MTSETCFVVKMKQTRRGQGSHIKPQEDCYRLTIMLKK